jgi:predicted outer membrane protein
MPARPLVIGISLSLAAASLAHAWPVDRTGKPVTAMQMAPSGPTTRRGLTPGEKSFVTTAAQSCMAQVQLGDAVQQKARSAAVKTLAQSLTTDHAAALRELSKFVTRKGMALPEKLDKGRQAAIARVLKLAGPKLDKAYLQWVNQDLSTDLAVYRNTSATAKDGGIRVWSTRGLGKVTDRLKLVRAAMVGGAGK